MTRAAFGQHLDLHAGGVDLAFPHHENEIAQWRGRAGRVFEGARTRARKTPSPQVQRRLEWNVVQVLAPHGPPAHRGPQDEQVAQELRDRP